MNLCDEVLNSLVNESRFRKEVVKIDGYIKIMQNVKKDFQKDDGEGAASKLQELFENLDNFLDEL